MELVKRSVRLPADLDDAIRDWARAHGVLFPDSPSLLFSDTVRIGMSWFLRRVEPATPIPGVDDGK